jgi:hypothetical protein
MDRHLIDNVHLTLTTPGSIAHTHARANADGDPDADRDSNA